MIGLGMGVRVVVLAHGRLGGGSEGGGACTKVHMIGLGMGVRVVVFAHGGIGGGS